MMELKENEKTVEISEIMNPIFNERIRSLKELSRKVDVLSKLDDIAYYNKQMEKLLSELVDLSLFLQEKHIVNGDLFLKDVVESVEEE